MIFSGKPAADDAAARHKVPLAPEPVIVKKTDAQILYTLILIMPFLPVQLQAGYQQNRFRREESVG